VKLNSKKFVSMLLLVLTLGSTAAFGLMQSFTWGNGGETAQVELPADSVIEYALTAAQKNYAIGLGRTLLEYRYPLACSSCAEQRAYLEFLVSKYPDQLLLQELSDNSLSKPTLGALSYYGSRTLTDPSQEAIFNLLCDTMVQPPVSCATR
jgi:hypothetical protein